MRNPLSQSSLWRAVTKLSVAQVHCPEKHREVNVLGVFYIRHSAEPQTAKLLLKTINDANTFSIYGPLVQWCSSTALRISKPQIGEHAIREAPPQLITRPAQAQNSGQHVRRDLVHKRDERLNVFQKPKS